MRRRRKCTEVERLEPDDIHAAGPGVCEEPAGGRRAPDPLLRRAESGVVERQDGDGADDGQGRPVSTSQRARFRVHGAPRRDVTAASPSNARQRHAAAARRRTGVAAEVRRRPTSAAASRFRLQRQVRTRQPLERVLSQQVRKTHRLPVHSSLPSVL